MKYFYTFLFAVVFCLSAISQHTAIISGTVNNTQQQPVAGAVVKLFTGKDSSLLQSRITDDEGKFSFVNCAPGTYFLNVASTSNKQHLGMPVKIDSVNKKFILPVIVLAPDKHKDLNEVVVKSKRPLVEQSIDKTIINVDAMLTAATSNTLEVLEKTPGVTVDNNGELSLNGKSGVLVLIDGRSSYMSGADLAAYLKSLPGGSLDKIELMTNPPAKYDAAGSAIINIRLKKNKIRGITGNISSGHNQGTKFRSNNAVNLNYNTGKISLFANMGYTRDAGYSKDTYDRKFYTSSTSLQSSVKLNNYSSSSSNSISSRFGIDYSTSSKTTVGVIFYINKRPKTEHFDYSSKTYNEFSMLDSTGVGYSNGSYSWTNLGANLNILHKFTDKGRELSADINYITYQTGGIQFLNNQVYLPGGTFTGNNSFFYYVPGSIHIYNAQADYTQPLAGNVRIDAGIKSSVVNNNSASEYYADKETGDVQDYTQSNHFIYKENINAVYLNARKDFGRLGIQTGMRFENTIANGHQLGNSVVPESRFNRNYTGLFPSFFLSYKLDSAGKNTLSFNLARRINRPNYQLLNPFIFYRDQYSYTSGNPGLTPQYNYQFELNYRYRQLLGIGLQYGRFTDIIFQTTKVEKEIFITRPDNIANGRLIALATNLSISPAKWWTSNTNIVFVRLALNGMAYSEKLNPSMYTGRINLLNQFKLGKGWNGELTVAYYYKDLYGQTIVQPRFRMNAGIQKNILKDKGSLRLSAEDIFHSSNQKDETVSLLQASSYHTGFTDTRRVGIAFTYRFGKQSNSNKREHKENTADEKGRVD